MKRLCTPFRVLLVLGAAALLAGCPFGGGGRQAGGDTPEEAFEQVRQLVAEKNWSGLYDLFSDFARTQLEVLRETALKDPGLAGKTAEEVADLSLRDFAASYLGKQAAEHPDEFDRLAQAEVVEVEKKDGTVVVRFRSGDRTDELRLVEVQERWFIESFL